MNFNRIVIAGMCVVMALLTVDAAHGQVGGKPGGVSNASVKDQGVVDAAAFAVKAQQKALKKAGKADAISLVKIMAAKQQVVQGMNYKLTLKVKVGTAVKTAEATVWARVWLKGDEQYKLTEWKFSDEK